MKPVKSIVIVGGGSAGWMTAAYLSRVLIDVSVTVIESKHTPIIGVGEATVPPVNRFMKRLGHPDYKTWLPHCNGSIKMGILFEDWLEKGDVYWHGYESLDYISEHVHTGHCWLNQHRNGNPECSERNSYYDDFFPTSVLNARMLRAPTSKSIAYNFNAHLFGDFMRSISPRVRRIEDDVVDVVLGDQGEILHLETAENGQLAADLFVDCTGFGRKIIRKVAPNEPFQSYGESLFCDRAVVLRYPYESEQACSRDMLPCALATAKSAGWIWTIPQYRQVGYGYVYSSRFLSDDAAEMELREYCGVKNTADYGLMKIKFESGKLRNLWIKNCVAIGLSGSFIEPLESTGLMISQMCIETLASVLDARCYDDFATQRFNTVLEKFCTDIEHFIIAHYMLSRREDTPFWRAVKHETVVPDLLAARFEVFKRHLPTRSTKGLVEPFFFADMSWWSVLLGMDFPFETPQVTDADVQAMRAIRERKRQVLHHQIATTAGHYEHLRDDIYCESSWACAAMA